MVLRGGLWPLGASKANPAPFTPASVPNMACWYAARFMTGMADGQQVTTWADNSGNGLDVSHAASAKIVYKTNIKNGLPVLRWTGGTASNALTRTNTAASALTDGTYCEIAIFTRSGSTTDCGLSAYTNGLGYTNEISGWVGNGGSLYFDFGRSDNGTGRVNVAQPANYANDWHILGWRRDAGNVQKILDQNTELISAGSMTAVPSGTQIWRIGNATAGVNGVAPFIGDMAEIVIYKSAVSSTNYANLITYYKTLYGI